MTTSARAGTTSRPSGGRCAATADSRRALRVLDALAKTGAGTLLVGHGEPWTRGAAAAVALAREAGVA
jgi:glyoxylase-like metal-dependent hydrolase (beta-lactamase superfamily II)